MNGIPAMAFSNTMHAPLHIAQAYLVPVIRELMEAGQGRGEVWNVNFPAVEPGELKGILRDRTVAPIPFYSENYLQIKNEDGSVSLKAMGEPMKAGDSAPEGSDAEAVLRGYISIGKVKSMVL